MNKLITKKILGYHDKTQTFVINTKQADTNREIIIQIVDALTLVDFSNVTSAYLNYTHNTKTQRIDLSSTIDKYNSSITLTLSEEILSATGVISCEIVLTDKNGTTILTTNNFIIKVKTLGGDCK